MTKLHRGTFRLLISLSALVALLVGAAAIAAQFQNPEPNPLANEPWMNKNLSADARADLLIQEMTLDDKIQVLHGVIGGQGSMGGAGFVPGIPRLGIPDLQMTDGRSGVANSGLHGRYATALPSSLANAATWDVKSAYEYGALLGKEVRELGFNVSLGGTANLIREPRNGRNFECLGEDPILIGEMLGQELKGTQDQKVIGNINRYVANDQETGRLVGNVVIDKRALQETDLLAFKIAIEESGVGTVMCAYNRLNGVYTCENPYVIEDVLEKSWGFNGWVMSDWGATHSTVESALAGFDQEMPDGRYYGDGLKEAVQNNQVPMARIDDMVHRILRTEISLGVFDNPATPQPVNPFADAEVAQQIEERAIVLLKNSNAQLPLSPSKIKSIAVIGGHADVGVLSGGGSDQVSPGGGNAVHFAPALRGGPPNPSYQPSSPLNAIRAEAPGATVQFDPGTDPAAAAQLAAKSEVAIVFVTQPTREGADVRSLSLPDNQDDLISKVATANRHVVVVVESGGPVTMPWIDNVGAVLETWFPGIRGGEAMANVLFGAVNPSGRLPVTFPKSEADIPHAKIFGMDLLTNPGFGSNEPGGRGRPVFPPFDIDYTEGLKVGYKWYETENKKPLFPFGFGLSYTTFAYSKLNPSPGDRPKISFSVTNKGKRAGEEVAQVYVELPAAAGEPFKRLVAWEKVPLAAGETKPVEISLDPEFLSIFDVTKENWELIPGDYKLYVGESSEDLSLNGTISIKSPN